MKRIGIFFCFLSSVGLLTACAEDGLIVGAPGADRNNQHWGADFGAPAPANNDGDFEPERPEAFDFSRPAVLGNELFVANEDLNLVAVIDTDTLLVRTVPVGLRPTVVAGPTSDQGEGRVFVLNEGSSSVSVIEQGAAIGKSHSVLSHSNSLVASPDGRYAITWYDATVVRDGAPPFVLDLSSVSVVTPRGAFDVAVGFRVQAVHFSSDHERAFVVSADGISVIDLNDLDGDALAPPRRVVPEELLDPELARDRQVLVDRQGHFALTRDPISRRIVLLDIAENTLDIVHLPTFPTDLDLVETAEGLRALITLRAEERAVLMTIPDGFRAASADPFFAAPIEPEPEPGPEPDMGGFEDMSWDMGAVADMGFMDAGQDLGVADLGADVGADMDASTEEIPDEWPVIDGVAVVDLGFAGLGLAQVDPTGVNAFFYGTTADIRVGVILHLEKLDLRPLAFEKGIRAATSDDLGRVFVALHTRTQERAPAGTPPSDPAFIEGSYGLTIVDVASGARRLVLTEEDPQESTLWVDRDGQALLYTIFAHGQDPNTARQAQYDVLSVDLRSFRTDSFRLPSLPAGIGPIPDSRKVFINQWHPGGRITFVDVDTQVRRTVTGYQLNAAID